VIAYAQRMIQREETKQWPAAMTRVMSDPHESRTMQRCGATRGTRRSGSVRRRLGRHRPTLGPSMRGHRIPNGNWQRAGEVPGGGFPMQAIELAFEHDWYDTDEVVAHINRLLLLVAKRAKRSVSG
jgi:hypothetical protein